MQHKHNPDNNWETPFDFTDDNYEIVSNIATHSVRPMVVDCLITIGECTSLVCTILRLFYESYTSALNTMSCPVAGSRDCGAVPYKLQSICNDSNLGSGPEAKQRLAQFECDEQSKIKLHSTLTIFLLLLLCVGSVIAARAIMLAGGRGAECASHQSIRGCHFLYHVQQKQDGQVSCHGLRHDTLHASRRS